MSLLNATEKFRKDFEQWRKFNEQFHEDRKSMSFEEAERLYNERLSDMGFDEKTNSKKDDGSDNNHNT